MRFNIIRNNNNSEVAYEVVFSGCKHQGVLRECQLHEGIIEYLSSMQ